MEDSFKVRVDRVFGSLEAAATASSSSLKSSLWCLTDQEIERNEWRIQDKPSSSSLHPDLEPDDHSNEEWNLRSSIGMDCTLDNEEEEDAIDKVALGEEERFYMREVNDYEVEIDSNNELPNSFTEAIRDPRANLMAAKLRLKQDDDESIPIPIQREDNNNIPDYVRNPSKYTHYTFDSMDDDEEESNKKAYMDLVNKSRRDEESNNMELDDDDSSTSIIFTPRNKSTDDDDGSVNKSKVNQKKKVVCVAMEEEDEPETEIAIINKTTTGGGRKYRTKNVVEE